jgi:L-amino acid N-acyltransferase YncA
MIGARPDWHGRGIGRCMMGEIARSITAGRYRKVFTTWIHEDNRYSTALARHLDLRPERTYAIFGKSL